MTIVWQVKFAGTSLAELTVMCFSPLFSPLFSLSKMELGRVGMHICLIEVFILRHWLVCFRICDIYPKKIAYPFYIDFLNVKGPTRVFVVARHLVFSPTEYWAFPCVRHWGDPEIKKRWSLPTRSSQTGRGTQERKPMMINNRGEMWKRKCEWSASGFPKDLMQDIISYRNRLQSNHTGLCKLYNVDLKEYP